MLLKFNQTKIVVDCFTTDIAAFELYKIRRASSYYPEVVKNMPSTYNETDPRTNLTLVSPTIKKCVGLNGLYSRGAIIPLWTDFIAQPRDYTKQNVGLGWASNPQSSVLQHNPKQLENILDNYIHVKLTSPWRLVEKSGIEFVYQGAFWNLNNKNEDFVVPPAILNFKDQSTTHFNFFMKKDLQRFELKSGLPVIQIIPLTEKDTKYQCHLVTEQEFDSKIFRAKGFQSLNKWLDHKKKSSMLDEKEKQKKCPFGFGK